MDHPLVDDTTQDLQFNQYSHKRVCHYESVEKAEKVWLIVANAEKVFQNLRKFIWVITVFLLHYKIISRAI